jgi:chromosome segregation ATPase
MVKKMVIPPPKPEPDPTPAPARITVGEKILARMDEVLSHVSGQEDLLARLESEVAILTQSILEVSEQLSALDTVLAKMQEGINDTRTHAEAAEAAVQAAGTDIGDIANAIPDVNEIVDAIRRQERIEWLASLKPAF